MRTATRFSADMDMVTIGGLKFRGRSSADSRVRTIRSLHAAFWSLPSALPMPGRVVGLAPAYCHPLQPARKQQDGGRKEQCVGRHKYTAMMVCKLTKDFLKLFPTVNHRGFRA